MNVLESADRMLSLQQNIQKREAAERAYQQCKTFAAKEAAELGWEDDSRFWEQLLRAIVSAYPQFSSAIKLERMSDSDATKFESKLIPFGKHRGTSVKEVPLDYLEWLTGDTFTDDLRRYVRSDKIEREVANEKRKRG
jgi:hypothetical protein